MRTLIRRFALAATTLILAVPLAVAASAASAGTTTQSVPGFSGVLTGISCPTASTCVAVGNTVPGLQPVVVTITKGTPGTAQIVPGNTVLLFGVDCSSASNCMAVGSFLSTGQGAVVPIAKGVPGTPQGVANTPLLNSVSCPSASYCLAVGGPTPLANPGGAVIVPIKNGTPGTAGWAPGTASLMGVSCSSATSCLAVGYEDTEFGTLSEVVPITNGSPGGAQNVAGTDQLDGVTCASATSCLAVGNSVVVPITNGTAGSAQAAAAASSLASVSCSSTTTCEAVGGSGVVPIINGTPGTAQATGMSSLTGIGCPSAATCYAVGNSSVGTINAIDATTMLLACSPNQPLLVGQPATCTATVTDPASPPNTPTGTVNFSSNGVGSFTGNPCTLAGTGTVASCSVTYALGAVTSQELTATYSGDATQTGSSASATLFPIRIPGKPVITSATAGNGQATVAFIPAASDQAKGNPITSYTVTVRPGVNVKSGPAVTTASGATSPITVTGLPNGTNYSVTVYASNAAGRGPESAPAVVFPQTVPGAPASVTATNATPVGATTGTVNLTITAPADDGGRPVLSYTAVSSPGGITATAAAGSPDIPVTGLTIGTDYTFTVYATNAVGNGPASDPSNDVTPTPVGMPSPPQVPGAATLDHAAYVSCVAPADDGGSSITSYTVTSSPSGITAEGQSCPILVTGLDDGTTYTFTVTATNADGGTSEPSLATAPVTPHTPSGKTPANDSFANAKVLRGTSGSVSGTNVGATVEVGEPTIQDSRGGASVWYVWTVPVTGSYLFDTCTANPGVAGLIGLFTGNSVSNASEFGPGPGQDLCAPGEAGSTIITGTMSAGLKLYIKFDGLNEDGSNANPPYEGPFTLNWSQQS